MENSSQDCGIVRMTPFYLISVSTDFRCGQYYALLIGDQWLHRCSCRRQWKVGHRAPTAQSWFHEYLLRLVTAKSFFLFIHIPADSRPLSSLNVFYVLASMLQLKYPWKRDIFPHSAKHRFRRDSSKATGIGGSGQVVVGARSEQSSIVSASSQISYCYIRFRAISLLLSRPSPCGSHV